MISWRRLLKPIASLRLTVVVLTAAMFLIFAGTLAQVHDGIWTVVDDYFRSYVVRIEFRLFVPSAIATPGGAFMFPGGIPIGVVMLVNLLAAHAVRFKLTWRRSGMILTHLGVILLLVGEFVTAAAAREGNMSIREGATARYTEDIRSAELAVIDGSGSEDDYVVVVPGAILARADQIIDNELLPFEIRVDKWMPNSQVFGLGMATPELVGKADSGVGSEVFAKSVPAATGVDGQNVDIQSAYITIFSGSERIGSYLVSVVLGELQPVVIGDKVYGIALRFKRNYKSYSMTLIDFKHDKFVGTEKARNFSSLVRLVDESRSVDREALIYMNHPLRYAGETFYQASYMQGDSGTVLQVVRNPGWLIPYISCIMVTVGMLVHFGIRLSPRKSSRGGGR